MGSPGLRAKQCFNSEIPPGLVDNNKSGPSNACPFNGLVKLFGGRGKGGAASAYFTFIIQIIERGYKSSLRGRHDRSSNYEKQHS